jgi:hypothetical protein
MHCGDGPGRQARDLVADKPFRCIPCLAPVTKGDLVNAARLASPRAKCRPLVEPG